MMLPLGTRVPDFRLPDSDGKLHGPADVAGAAGLLVAFVCDHCPFVIHIGPTETSSFLTMWPLMSKPKMFCAWV